MSSEEKPKDGHSEIQAAGKSLMTYTFSLMKTGEVHELNNDAWIMPIEKFRNALEHLFRIEDQAITFVVYDGLAQVNSHALWLDKGSLEQVEELERFLGRREAGGIVFKKLPEDNEIKDFFFQFARFTAVPGSKDQRRAFNEMLIEKEISGISVTPQPLNLDGMGQGVRGVPAIWHYCKAVAGMEDIYSRRPLAIRDAVHLAQEIVDACALEQDLLVAFTLMGNESSIPRDSVNTAILCASVGRGIGLERVHCADLAICGILHLVGSTYPNPDLSVWTADESMSLLALRQLNDSSIFNGLVGRRICAAVEWRMGPDGEGAPNLVRPQPLQSVSQLIKAIRYYLDLVHKSDPPKSPFSAAMEMLETPPSGVNPTLLHMLIGVIGLLPVGSLVELQNGDIAVVSDIEHLRGHKVYGQVPAPVTEPRTIHVDRMYTAGGEVIPERRARVQLGGIGQDGEWTVQQVLGVDQHREIIVRGMFSRPPAVTAQLGVRVL